MADLTGLQQRSVISAFIFSQAEVSPRVALFRRSDQVTTYHHHLAPISGHIEVHETPVTAAWRELREETTLTPDKLFLWRQGKPFTFSDVSVGRQWTVHPFAFRLKGPDEGCRGDEAIQTNWEHEEWEWHDPRTVVDSKLSGGVPRLEESLRRVWFEGVLNDRASKALNTGIAQLVEDHQSGSHELTSIALKAFQQVLVQIPGVDTKWWETARMVAWHLWKNGRESMGAATLNALLGVLSDMEDIVGRNVDHEAKWDLLLTTVDSHLMDRKAMPARIKDSVAAYLYTNFLPTAQSRPNSSLTLLTLSASSTIRDSILDAYASLPFSNLDLRVLESRPLYEGVSMASSILSEFQSKFASSNQRLTLTVYTDASAALASHDVDFVLLGADRISGSGWVSNKTGSLPAVLSAKHAAPNVKVLILSELEKVAEPGAENEHVPEENDPNEVVSRWLDAGVKGVGILAEGLQGVHPPRSNTSVEVKNVYFEWVPADMIDAYICEAGTLDAAAIQEKARQVKEKAERYFGEL
ncbi:hypothetical protein NUU61_008456 [Penicillium alfredii]|uniref:Nudix hydrolase domain-containing protein n=1 Tax=Penicillium alfredii TaxID=1506179 RepID=A0A9W9EL72_9EURO|nr:uncharacterized protein NUU61_008456 [Penicillium alfredii]KAJ5083877.1 hypothetical protein NUU61_008456 [Penicillium alfredii]